MRVEVLEFEAGREPASAARREDIHEVLNYRAAMRRAEDMMRDLPLCQRVVREAHGVLLAHVRGQDKAPGEYRRTAVWIGPPGSAVDEAKFVPVDAQRLPDAMSAWERYIHADAPDRLVQLAILHAEFEALHPFLDGNGRMGRLFVPLFLWRHGQIRAPTFYIGAWFEAHRDAYSHQFLFWPGAMRRTCRGLPGGVGASPARARRATTAMPAKAFPELAVPGFPERLAAASASEPVPSTARRRTP